jgi:hypothetical protein
MESYGKLIIINPGKAKAPSPNVHCSDLSHADDHRYTYCETCKPEENEEIPRCGVEVVHVISSAAVLFQDLLELLAIYLRKRTIAVIEISLIVLALQAVQASRLLAASAELGPSGKKPHSGV